MAVTCPLCDDYGFNFDRRCMDDLCAHRGRLKVVRDTDGNTKRVRERIMDCPRRPCSCPEGKPERGKLAKRIRAQEKRFAAMREFR